MSASPPAKTRGTKYIFIMRDRHASRNVVLTSLWLVIIAAAWLSPTQAQPIPQPKPEIELVPVGVPSEPLLFKIATGSHSGTYFSIGNGLATIISHPPQAIRCLASERCGPEGLIAVAQTSDGSARNIQAVYDGKVASALVQADVLEAAATGVPPFERLAGDNVFRVIARLYPEIVHLVALNTDEVEDVSDLAGKRVSIGQSGSGSQTIASLLLEAAELPAPPAEIKFLNLSQSIQEMQAGDLDAFFFVGGPPIDLIAEVVGNGTAKLIPLREDQFGPLNMSAFRFEPLPNAVYAQLDGIGTIQVDAIWIAHASVSHERVYEITKALWHEDNREILDSSHPQGTNIRLENAVHNLPVALHPGAEQYYGELGLLTPDLTEAEANADIE